MRRFILTGAPGAGKTSVIRLLETKGCVVVHEAATDVIAYEQLQGNSEPWKYPNFIDKIVTVQNQRQRSIENHSSVIEFYDRSPICTYALSVYLGFKPSNLLLQEIERIERESTYQKKVFFIENLGFCELTEARKISFEESLIFEEIHKETYSKFGYESVKINRGSQIERVNIILDQIKL